MQYSLNVQKINPGRVEVNPCKHTMKSNGILIPLSCSIKIFKVWPLAHGKTPPFSSLMIFTFTFLHKNFDKNQWWQQAKI